MLQILAMINDVLHEKLAAYKDRFESEGYVGDQDRHEDRTDALRKEIRFLMKMRLELEMSHAHLSYGDLMWKESELKVLTDRFNTVWTQAAYMATSPTTP